MKKVILDTNFLLLPSQFNVDVFTEIDRIVSAHYELCVMSTTLDELNNVINSDAKGKDKTAAKLALKLVEHKNIQVIDSDVGYVDKAIMEIVNKEEHIVATQDKELKQSLQENGIPIIILRQKKYLELIES